MSRKAAAFRGFLVAVLASGAGGCGAGFSLTKPGGTLEDYMDDQAACKAAIGKTLAQQPAAARPPTAGASTAGPPQAAAPVQGAVPVQSGAAPAQAAAPVQGAAAAPAAAGAQGAAPAPAAASPPKTNSLGLRMMDPQVYNCMLAKGWRPPG
ncbi:MAG TPA: hypothetical protein VI113_12915 [Alphaproteobacteria bacterium]